MNTLSSAHISPLNPPCSRPSKNTVPIWVLSRLRPSKSVACSIAAAATFLAVTASTIAITTPADDVLQAINEHFIEREENHPVGYLDLPPAI